jgi:hypothetical protein
MQNVDSSANFFHLTKEHDSKTSCPGADEASFIGMSSSLAPASFPRM